jgi:hypothetical protein
MAVVNKKSNLVADYLNRDTPPDPSIARGRPIIAIGTVANASDDSSGSTYHLIDLPSDCLLDIGTAFDVENWGFAAIRIGTKDDVDALVSVAKSAGNTVTPNAFGDANHGKQLWEQLGLAADPGGMISIYAHAIAGATGAGSMPFRFAYLFR